MVLIPPHWTIHDGQDCPVPDDTCPAVMFRRNAYGLRTPLTIAMGTMQAAKWLDYGDRNCWQWLPGGEDGQDIVAYIPDHGARVDPENVRV